MLERVSGRWWFYPLLLAVMMAPMYSERPYDPASESPRLVLEVLQHPLIYNWPPLFPLFKVAALLLLALLWWRSGPLVSRLTYLWAGINLAVIAVLQNAGHTPNYGFAVISGNVVLVGLIAMLFLLAATLPTGARLNLRRRLPWWRWWVAPLALFAFWLPVNWAATPPQPDFNPALLVLNEAGLTFCMMLPFYLALLSLGYPAVDGTILRVGGFIGFVIALMNFAMASMAPQYGPWMATLHVPLLLISAYAFVLGWRLRAPVAVRRDARTTLQSAGR